MQAAQEAHAALDYQQSDAVLVEVPSQCLAMIDQPNVATRLQSLCSAQFQVAAALCRPALLYDLVRADLPEEREVYAMMTRIRVAASPSLAEAYPRRWGAIVSIDAGGATRSVRVDAPRGSAPDRLDWPQLGEKYAGLGLASSTWDALRSASGCVTTQPRQRHAGALLAIVRAGLDVGGPTCAQEPAG